VAGQYWCEEVEKMTTRGEVSRRGARGAFYRPGNRVERSGGGQSSNARWCSINPSVT
jgi:hypothetical protein